MALTQKFFSDMKAYLDLLLVYQNKLNEGLVMTYDKGYWWCVSDKKLARYEQKFLDIASQTKVIIDELERVADLDKKTHLLHLLGWAGDMKMAGEMLVQHVTSRNSDHANAALRSLFPLVVTGKYKLNKRLIHDLLYARPLVVKNKVLGLLAFLPQDQISSLVNNDDVLYIKQLAKHRNKPIIATPAQMVLGRLSSK